MKKRSSDTVNSLHPEPTPYVFCGSTTALADRKSQPCRIHKWFGNTVIIEFVDGFRAVVPRYVVRRKREVDDGEATRRIGTSGPHP